MTYFAVWIDRENAKLFQFSREKMERRLLKTHSPDHHTHLKDHHDIERKEKRLFQDVVENLAEANQIILLGPGIVKYHFQNYLNEHHPALSKKIIACETVDHPSDAQIAAEAMKFFR